MPHLRRGDVYSSPYTPHADCAARSGTASPPVEPSPCLRTPILCRSTEQRTSWTPPPAPRRSRVRSRSDCHTQAETQVSTQLGLLSLYRGGIAAFFRYATALSLATDTWLHAFTATGTTEARTISQVPRTNAACSFNGLSASFACLCVSPSTTDGSDLAMLQRVDGDLPKAARVLHFRSPDFGAAAEEAFLGPPPVRGHSGSRLRAVRKLDFGSAPVERGTYQGQPLRKGLQFGCTSSARVPGKRRQTLLLGSQDAPDFIGRTLRTASLLETSLQTPWRE